MSALWIFLIILAWLVCDRLVHAAFVKLGSRGDVPFRLGRGLERVVRLLLFSIGLLAVCEAAGVQPERLWTALSAFVALLAVGFVAFWSVASNVLCAFILHFVRPFRVGDDIELFDPNNEKAGVRGKVLDIGAFYTVLADAAHEQGRLLIPNNLILQRGVRLFKGAAA